ncbi:polysaccharide deacetylase family protein, partial [Parabacteroides goldsteinii]
EQTGKNICRAILFVRSGGKCKQDKPHYSLRNTDISQLIQSALSNDITIGLHSSYQAGIVPTLIKKEKTWLEKNVERSIRFNRHHFLASREPEDMTHLEAAGITDDFTMGYADVAGFRLGTSYPVRWINPVTRRLSSILLHPLTIMDCTLEEKKYMGLNYEEALAYSLNLIEQVKNTGGELTLLWHNTSAQENTDSYLRKLYSHLLNELAKK